MHIQNTKPAWQIAGRLFFTALICLSGFTSVTAYAQDTQREYELASGDTIRILVFQNPDLTLDTRVSENGSITFPLIGNVQIGKLTIPAAEKTIANALSSGGFIKQPQVNIVLMQVVGNQAFVLGYVTRPGSYPLPTANSHLTQLLAIAGGTAPGANKVIVSGQRDGKKFQKEIDISSIYLEGKTQEDILISGGDTIYIPQPPVFYIYGEVQKPGGYPLERNMNVAQALALGGGPTSRGTERGLVIKRRDEKGSTYQINPKMEDPLLPNDVLYVKESLF